jgi:hypothetical protein
MRFGVLGEAKIARLNHNHHQDTSLLHQTNMPLYGDT